MNPTQIRWIYNKHNTEEDTAKYKTWTQIKRLVEWPPCKNAVFMFWNDTVLVGANYDEETRYPLQEWRQKYSLNKIAVADPDQTVKQENPYYSAWKEMYLIKGMRQSDIAKELGISVAYCSIIKKKHKLNAFDVE